LSKLKINGLPRKRENASDVAATVQMKTGPELRKIRTLRRPRQLAINMPNSA
jgi:hypothetical protein